MKKTTKNLKKSAKKFNTYRKKVFGLAKAEDKGKA